MKHKISGRSLASMGWRHVCVALLLAACGGIVGKPVTGGESHFLRHCAESCGGGLDCISGVCTRGCLVGDSSCTDLSRDAACTAASIEPGAVAVCDVGCDSSVACSGLGTGFECEAGFCRGPGPRARPISRPPVVGGAGAGAGGANAFPSCSVSTGAPCSSGEVCVDKASDGCDPNTSSECLGQCQVVYAPLACSGFGPSAPCPVGFACMNTSAGTDPTGICVQELFTSVCVPGADETCFEGFVCVPGSGNGGCVPQNANCWAQWTCDRAEPDVCPFGYARSRTYVDNGTADCFGPCVPIDTCGCSGDAMCGENAVCDHMTGRCAALPWQLPALCSLPVDPGPCKAASSMFAAVGGTCSQQPYGGCEGNANNFGTIEECMAVCEGRPIPNACPDGRVRRSTCVACGVVGGCGHQIDACAEPCQTANDCESPSLGCFAGFCGAVLCE